MPSARRAPLALLAALALLLGVVTPAGATPVTTGTVTGTVIMPEGLEVPTGPTGLQIQSIRTLSNGSTTIAATTPVEADGSFVVSNLVPAQYRFRFRGTEINTIEMFHDGSYLQADAVPIAVVAGDNPPLSVQLRTGGSISGAVIGEDGQPVTAGWIQVMAGAPEAFGRTGAKRIQSFDPNTGRYLVDTLPPGRYLLRFEASGVEWRPMFSDGNVAGIPGTIVHTLIEVGVDEHITDADFVLARTPSIVGEYRAIRDESLTGPEPVELTARAFPGTYLGTNRTVTVPDEGPYRIPGLGIGQYQLCTSSGGVIPDDPTLRVCYGEDADNPDGVPITVDTEVVSGFDIAVPMRSSVALSSVRYPSVASPGGLRDVSVLRVLFWKLDESSGAWLLEQEVDAQFDPFANSGRVLSGGDYRIEILFGDHSTPEREASWHRDYWPGGVQSFGDAEVLPVPRGAQLDLGEVLVQTFPVTRARLWGNDRFSSAVELSRSAFAPGSGPTVYITNGLNYPDALAAGPAAALSGGPLLLVRPTEIPEVVAAELRRLQPDRIVVVGGSAVVSAAVESQLRSYVASPSDVTRLSGADRYATGRAVVSSVFAGRTGGVVFLATGANYPDALAAGAAAGSYGGPVVLVNGTSSTVDSATLALLDTLNPAGIVIAGGTGAVSAAIESALLSRYQSRGTAVLRLSGNDRYETAYVINQLFSGADSAYIASGQGFADALAAGPIAARSGSPLYLAEPTCIPAYVLADIDALLARRTFVVGGSGVLSESVLEGRPC